MIYPICFICIQYFTIMKRIMIFACRKRFSTFKGKGELGFWWIFFRLWLPIPQSAFIFIQFDREYLFLTTNFNEIFENINMFFPSLYGTPLPFFNNIIIKEISGVFFSIYQPPFTLQEYGPSKITKPPWNGKHDKYRSSGSCPRSPTVLEVCWWQPMPLHRPTCWKCCQEVCVCPSNPI